MTVLASLVSWLSPESSRQRLVVTGRVVGVFATVYLLSRIRYFGDASRHAADPFAPVGVCSVVSTPLPGVATWALAGLGVLLGMAFVAGRGLRVVGPAFFLVLLWLVSYASSWGKILHTENLLVLHVGIFALAGNASDERVAGWALRAASVATVLTYLVAGITKLRHGGTAWLSGEALGDWLAWDALRKMELGSFSSPLAAHVASSPGLLQALAIYTLLVELGAPIALVSDRSARVWVLCAWCFHFGILATMAIGFFYPLSGVAFAPLLHVERLPLLRRLGRSR